MGYIDVGQLDQRNEVERYGHIHKSLRLARGNQLDLRRQICLDLRRTSGRGSTSGRCPRQPRRCVKIPTPKYSAQKEAQRPNSKKTSQLLDNQAATEHATNIINVTTIFSGLAFSFSFISGFWSYLKITHKLTTYTTESPLGCNRTPSLAIWVRSISARTPRCTDVGPYSDACLK